MLRSARVGGGYGGYGGPDARSSHTVPANTPTRHDHRTDTAGGGGTHVATTST